MMKNVTIPESVMGSSAAPIKTVWVKSGFALGPAGSFFKSARPLRIEIEGMRLLSPAQIKDLLQNRKSIEEIKMLIEEEANPSFIYRGKMKLDGESYRLVDVDLRSMDSETVLKADLAEIRWGREAIWSSEAAGDVVGRIETKEGIGDARGTLMINQGTLSGRYKVHLDAYLED
ncbi:MAG TPA: hypothetical protein PLM24_02395 [Methanothrix sp.]|nr:hypothetical protein [Methanothrix sp.]HPJ84464.1 hypothetical protein [Methanothrix sp.]HPR65970.1 hypothetical protein [Methanothrix sp.]